MRSWWARDPETGCGCCTNLTLECPVLLVSPFTGRVLSEALCFSLTLSLKIFVLNSLLAGNVVFEIDFGGNCYKFLLFVTRCRLNMFEN